MNIKDKLLISLMRERIKGIIKLFMKSDCRDPDQLTDEILDIINESADKLKK